MFLSSQRTKFLLETVVSRSLHFFNRPEHVSRPFRVLSVVTKPLPETNLFWATISGFLSSGANLCILHHSAGAHTRWAGPLARRMSLSNISGRPMYVQSKYSSRERGIRALCLDVRLPFLGHRLSLGRVLTRQPTDHQMTFFQKQMKGEP